MMSRWYIVAEIADELKRQDEKWGIQNHDKYYWNTIIAEELGESAEGAFDLDSARNSEAAKHYTDELVHVAACAIQAIETLRRLHPEWNPENGANDQGARPKEVVLSEVSAPQSFYEARRQQMNATGDAE